MNTSYSQIKLTSPKLTLYAFHLRNDLSIGFNKPLDNANHLWDKCQELGNIFNIKDLESLSNKLKKYNYQIGLPATQDYPEKDYLELLAEPALDFTVPNTYPQLTGEVYPLQIHDTYAVDITLRYPDTTVNINDLTGLNPNGFLLPNQMQASLGQTLVLFAQPVGNIKDYRRLAEECFRKILPNQQIEKLSLNVGYFLGSPIFEYDNGQEKPGKNLHILIWFNCYPITEAKESEGKYYQILINLLCCRSKVIYAYSESRWCNERAKCLYQDLKNTVEEFDNLPNNLDDRLQKLKKILTDKSKEAFTYARQLRDLEIQLATIKSNATNYKLFLEKLHQISVEERDNLTFLQDFLEHIHNKLVAQIQVDLDYLNPGRILYGEIIDSIRGLIAITQTESDREFQEELKERERQEEEKNRKRDRNLQIWLAAVGSGLAVSGVSSQVLPQPITTYLSKPVNNETKPEIPYLILDGVFHIGLGIVVAVASLIFWGTNRYINRPSKFARRVK